MQEFSSSEKPSRTLEECQREVKRLEAELRRDRAKYDVEKSARYPRGKEMDMLRAMIKMTEDRLKIANEELTRLLYNESRQGK